MSECFLKPKSLEANVEFELDLSKYASKVDLKKATGPDISDFAKKTDLATSKSAIDKLDIDKLKKLSKIK